MQNFIAKISERYFPRPIELVYVCKGVYVCVQEKKKDMMCS